MRRLIGDYEPVVFWASAIVVVLSVVIGVVAPSQFASAMGVVQYIVTDGFGWFLLLGALSYLVYMIYVGLSKYGQLKLGKEDDEPEYSRFSWIAMLFSCNLGVAFLFWGVAEPMYHFMQPPYLAEGGTAEAVILGPQITLFHYLPLWTTFALVGLAMAFFAYREDKPLTCAYGLYGLLGDKVEGPIGKFINFLAIFATVGGIATSVGMGVMQMKFGFGWLFNVETSNTMLLIIFITFVLLYTISVSTGISRGIKYLSNLNLTLALIVLVYVFLAGPTLFILKLLPYTLGGIVDKFFVMATFTDPADISGGWPGWWTIFYRCWDLSWAPFCGGFLARISKGRTIREFALGAIFLPMILTIAWYIVMGGTGIWMHFNNVIDLWSSVSTNASSAIFIMFDQLVLGKIFGAIVFVNIITFLVTSADSASFFNSMIASKGVYNPKLGMRIFWAVGMGLTGIILMFAGDMEGVKTAAIVTGAPFSIVLIAMMFSVTIGMNKALKEQEKYSAAQTVNKNAN